MKEITDDTGYKEIMDKIDGLMDKGSESVSKEELAKIRSFAQMAQAYEQAMNVI